MDDRKPRALSLLFLASFFCALFRQILDLLYAWGEPSWFSLFPATVGLRLILALSVYLLSCLAYSFFGLLYRIVGRAVSFPLRFSLCFFAVPVFAALVTFGASLQVLHAFDIALDLAFSLASLLLLVLVDRRKSATLRFRRAIHLWILFPSFLALADVARFALPFPSWILSLISILVLAVLASMTLLGLPPRAIESPAAAALRYRLSSREAEVLGLLSEGKTNEEIAQQLFISLSTVKTHLSSIFLKTGARNRLEVVTLCEKS